MGTYCATDLGSTGHPLCKSGVFVGFSLIIQQMTEQVVLGEKFIFVSVLLLASRLCVKLQLWVSDSSPSNGGDTTLHPSLAFVSLRSASELN
jgi:hypothetical protein